MTRFTKNDPPLTCHVTPFTQHFTAFTRLIMPRSHLVAPFTSVVIAGSKHVNGLTPFVFAVALCEAAFTSLQTTITRGMHGARVLK